MSPDDVTVYPAPEGSPVSKDYAVTVGGKQVAVYSFPTAHESPAFFAYCDIQGPVSVEVTANFLPAGKITAMSVHPRSLDITGLRENNRLDFKVDHPCSVTVLVNGQHKNRPLHVFLNPPVEAPPKEALVFGPGKHDPGYDRPINLTDGQVLYLAGGAWVEGIVRARNAKNIRVMGRGVLSQSVRRGKDYAGNQNVAPAGMAFVECQDVSVSGIIDTRAVGGWVSLLQNCDRVTVSHYHVVASVIPSTDGFNPCNSRDVLIENSFFRTADDCIAIKGNTGESVVTHPGIPPGTQPPVENITIRGCTFWNDRNNVIVIGAETRARHIRHIRIQDCDILFHNEYFRDLGALSIIPLHGTEIRNVTYEDIRVEHIENQLFCFRFVDELYNIPGDQTFPGIIADITIRNVAVLHQARGPRSEFSGWSAGKPIENVTIQGLRYGAKIVHDEKGIGLRRNKHVKGVRFPARPANR